MSGQRDNPHSYAGASAGRYSGSGKASGFGSGRGSNVNAGCGPGPDSRLAEIQKQSGKEKGPIEDWKQQPKGGEPWSPTGRKSGRSLGGLGSFVGHHGEIIDDKKR